MSISNYLPNNQSSYAWFFYLGIAFFITHLIIYGIGLNISFFGLLLIYIGARRPVLSNWFRNVLWFFIIIDIYANISIFRQKIENRFFVTFDKKVKEGVKTKNNKKKSDDNDDDNDKPTDKKKK
jgi:phosphoglycerol transferase MdoB-like AlkP superfamily enzyme